MFDYFDVDDMGEAEPTPPEESYSSYATEPVDNNSYDANAAYPSSYLSDADSEMLNELDDGHVSSSLDAAPSENLEAAPQEETCSHSHTDGNTKPNCANKVSFCGSGPGSRCKLCACSEFLWPTYGKICKNCGHHYDHHL